MTDNNSQRIRNLNETIESLQKEQDTETYVKNIKKRLTAIKNKDSQIVSPDELNVGPDTTENIYEVSLAQDRQPREKDGDETHLENNYYEPWEEKDNLAERIKKAYQETFRPWEKNSQPINTIRNKWQQNNPGDETHLLPNPDSFDGIVSRMQEIHNRKNSDYGGAADEGYQRYGITYYLSILFNKLKRLESLTLGNKSRKVLDESIEDTLLDMANYAVLALESIKKNQSKNNDNN